MKVRPIHVLGAALLLSLGLNVFLGGYQFGNWAIDGPRHSGGSRFFDRDAARAAVGPEAQKEVDAIRAKYEPMVREKFDAARQARRELKELLIADTFDPAAVEALQAAISARQSEARQALTEELIALAAKLPPEERKRYFAAGNRPDPKRDAPPPPPPTEN